MDRLLDSVAREGLLESSSAPTMRTFSPTTLEFGIWSRHSPRTLAEGRLPHGSPCPFKTPLPPGGDPIDVHLRDSTRSIRYAPDADPADGIHHHGDTSNGRSDDDFSRSLRLTAAHIAHQGFL